MLSVLRPRPAFFIAVASIVILLAGCTNISEYVRNGFKVGPNYCPAGAPVANNWIDAADVRIRSRCDDISQWWTVFNDPVLNNLIAIAYCQNLTVKEAGFRVLQARALLGITQGELFPQSQNAFGSYTRQGSGTGGFADRWNFGFSLAWELDFWGRFRRAVLAASAQLDSSVAGYDDVMVTLLSDVASNYVRIRTDQERKKLLQENVELQKKVLVEVVEKKLAAGLADELDRDQAVSNLRQSEAGIYVLEIDIRQAGDQLCVLLGIPPADLQNFLGAGAIPASPPDVALGIPAEMLRRRPDISGAERDAAAQAEQIGIALTDLYPAFTISGTLSYQANNFADLFSSKAFSGNVGPSFNWNLLNYGRIINNVRLQDARFQELIVTYQNTVLQANSEVEDGLVTFLRAQNREKLLSDSVRYAQRAVETIIRQYDVGKQGVDFNRYAVIEQNKIQQEDSWAQARGEIAQGLILVYRALGGGWEIRFNPPPLPPVAMPVTPPPGFPPMPEVLPQPLPEPTNTPQQLPQPPQDVSTALPGEGRRAS